MGWPEIRELVWAGVSFGAHSPSHPRLTSLSVADAVRDRARSRALFQRGLGRGVTALAYRHGDCDAVVQHLAGACGFVYGLTCEHRRSAYEDDLLAPTAARGRGPRHAGGLRHQAERGRAPSARQASPVPSARR